MKSKKVNCDYELMYLVNKEYKDLKQLETKIMKWLEINDWKYKDLGERKFAYPIEKQTIGRYILSNFTCNREKIPFLKEKLRWVPEILRYLLINLSEEKRFRHYKSAKKETFTSKPKEKKELKPIEIKLKESKK